MLVRVEVLADVLQVIGDGDVRDGEALVAPSLDGRAVRVNPGPHTVKFKNDSTSPIEQTIVAREGERDRAVSVQFQAPASTSVATIAPITSPALPSPGEKEQPAKSSTLRWVGVATGAVGVVALGVGAGLAVAAKSKWDDAVKQCGAGCLPGSPPYATRDDASTLATASTVAVIAGAVLAAGGVTLIIVGKPGRPTTVALQPSAGGLWLGGSF